MAVLTRQHRRREARLGALFDATDDGEAGLLLAQVGDALAVPLLAEEQLLHPALAWRTRKPPGWPASAASPA